MATALPFFLVLTILLLNRKGRPMPSKRDFAGMAVLGLFGYYLASVLDFHGMVYVTAGMERLLLYLYPSFLVLIRSVVEKTLPKPIEVVALIIAYTGAAFVYHEEHQGASANVLLGSFLILGSALSFAFYLYFSQSYAQKYGSMLFASYSTTVSCVAILIHALLRPGNGGMELTGYVIFLCVVTGLICTVASTYLMHLAISMIGSAKFGIMGTSGIISPLILGIVFFADPLSLNRTIGICLVLSAVLLLGWKKKEKARARNSLDLTLPPVTPSIRRKTI